MTKTFSIVMPTLNAEAFLRKSIESILAQTKTEWELLIVDGGSSDDTLKIAHDFAARDPRITTTSLPGSGIYEALTDGFDRAGGDVFAWLNADDLYTPWAFACAEMWMQRSGVDWLCGQPAIFDSAGVMRCIYPHIRLSQFVIRKGLCHSGGLGCIQAESTFFSKDLYQKLSDEQIKKVQELRLAGDFLLWRYFAHHAALHKIPTVLAGFRLHGQNRSTSEIGTYEDEVRAAGAVHLGRLPARILQILLGSLGGARAHVSAVRENSKLNQSLQNQAPPS